jgi:hypothetical protein
VAYQDAADRAGQSQCGAAALSFGSILFLQTTLRFLMLNLAHGRK